MVGITLELEIANVPILGQTGKCRDAIGLGQGESAEKDATSSTPEGSQRLRMNGLE